MTPRDRLIEMAGDTKAPAIVHLVRHPTREQPEAGIKELGRAVPRVDQQPRCYGDADLCLKQIFRAIIDA